MASYLKEFSTHAEYEQYINGGGAILPNVSICTNEGDVHYTPPVDPYAGHDYVEIGGLKWATMNVGANSITDAGLYFQWGDISGYTASQVGSGEGQKYFDWADYKYCSGAGTSSSAMTKYQGTGEGKDGKTALEASDDAAVANWGGSWRMPTRDEYVALGNAVDAAWTDDYQGSGVAGLICTDKTDSSKVLFFPACGYCYGGRVYRVDDSGVYWSNSLNSGNVQYAHNLDFYDGHVDYWWNNNDRILGFPVRGVAN